MSDRTKSARSGVPKAGTVKERTLKLNEGNKFLGYLCTITLIVLTGLALGGQTIKDVFQIEGDFGTALAVGITVYIFASAGCFYAWSQAEATAKER